MSEVFQKTTVATVWVTAGDVILPNYQVNPIVLSRGQSTVVWNLVTLNLGESKADQFDPANGISLNPSPASKAKVLWQEWISPTQWAMQIDYDPAGEGEMFKYKINSSDDPGPDDPTIIFTTDPVIPPPG